MRYIKFRDGKKQRCLKALDYLRRNEMFVELVDSMFEETQTVHAKNCENRPTDDVELGPDQGVARAFRELVAICRDPLNVGRSKRVNPNPDH